MTTTNRRPRSWRGALACAFAAAVWATGAAGTLAQDHDQHEAGAHAHADAAKIKNPVKPSAASIAKGKSLYESQCVNCHGATGVGDGKSAAPLNPKPSNLADATWKHGSSDGEIFTLIKEGSPKTSMRGYASKMTEEDIWNVVNYIRTLSTAK
ncbi:MAG TPA: c-type cytochrome [Vicinamibacterales bacterium]|jgi:mono/diheme cytochrome c family protein|nr:c-type cytochrome [Vicinamibacterales bacterium]